ncbi:4Fe-4S dicluster domain-containing protein [Eisenbergiella porci]|uniref:4Fe-4S dicluster domain-containing protein n=1 Tax=Eisenbergiella porci TaxID=2652274 RepID=UPI0022E647AF|nr:4Fe-4S dicluster domain-containing protein [Eisenbergiella porci]
MQKDKPILFDRKEQCCGCTACFAVCPKNAITMKPDEEGFMYPNINDEMCIRCYKCITVCPIKNKL